MCVWPILKKLSYSKSEGEFNFYRGPHFWRKHLNFKKSCSEKIKFKIKIMLPLTVEEYTFYFNWRVCYICKEFQNEDSILWKSKDRSYFPEKYGATVQNICDIDTKLLKKLPILSIMG